MNPYIQNVLDRQESLATRTLEEEFLPSLQRTFGGAGQYGSRGGVGSMEDIGVRGVRDIQEDLEKQRLATLGEAYGQGADIFGAGQQRQAEMARIVGALEEAGAQQMFTGARGLGEMGGEAQRMGLTDAASMEAIGRQTRGMDQASLDLAYQDFLEQRELPFERVGFMSDIIRGLPSQGRTIQRTDVGPADVYQPSGLSQLAGAYGVYRGLNPQGGAEGGYVEGDGYAEGGYIEGEYDDVTDYDEYAIGGLARAATSGVMDIGRRAVGALSKWARQLYPDFGRSVGSAGGHHLELQHKQD